mgnify:CR=1 FL=1
MPSTKKPSEFNDNNSVADSSINELQKRRRALYYTSNVPDSFIKNAQNGHLYPYRVGSFESLKLYKVIDSSGTIDQDGIKLPKLKRPNCHPNVLYYDNPEEYMRHRRIKLDTNIINAWKNKVNKLFSKDGKFNNDEWRKLKQENT